MMITLLVVVLLSFVIVLIGQRYAETNWGQAKFNWIDGIVRLLCRSVHRLELTKPVPLPDSGPAIIVANHISGLDPFLLISACRRPLRFLIAREEYQRPGLSWLFKVAGCIPVDRTHRPEVALRQALKALQSGEVVALFPHGKIHLDHEPPIPIKGGVVRLANWSSAPIIPLRIEGVGAPGTVALAPFVRSHARLIIKPIIDARTLDKKSCLEAVHQAISPKSPN